MTSTAVWLIVSVAAIVVAGAVIVAARAIAEGLKLDLGDLGKIYDDPTRRGRFQSTPPGSMPLSVRLSGIACRFTEKIHWHDGEQFWKNFEDGPWKWDNAGRYAASGVNPGYYFAFSPREARSEILHHLKDERELVHYDVLLIEGEIDNILDLTSTSNIKRICDELQILNNPYDILGHLVTAATRGSYFTDGFGAYAYERGYSGILFFSARNIDPSHRTQLQSDGYYHEEDELIFKAFTADDMHEKDNNRCIVVFDGAELLRSIRRYRIVGKTTIANPYYKADKQLILNYSSNHGASYQDQRRRWRGCPMMLWGPPRCPRCGDDVRP